MHHRLGARARDDRGAVAVIVALMMTVLLGFVAIAVDTGALYFERQQLQNGADAAALAVACHRGTAAQDTALATSMAGLNANDGKAAATVTPLSGGQVRIDTSTLNTDGTTALPLTFAPVLGISSSTVRASATAACGYPSGGTAMLPVIFSYCSFAAQTGGGLPSSTQPRTIEFSKGADPSTSCTGHSGNPVPGGFNWLKPDANCSVTTAIGTPALSSPGKTPNKVCDAQSMAAIQNKTILLPLFEQSGGNGANAYYVPSAYAAFTVTGYDFGPSHGGAYRWNPPSCNDYCIGGYFVGYTATTSGFTYSPSAPNYGASAATLTA